MIVSHLPPASGLDQYAINHMTVALGREMVPNGFSPAPEINTLFMGGPVPSEAELQELGHFALAKNYRIVFASFIESAAEPAPARYDVMVNDGVSEAYIMPGGRLWKRDRRSASVIVFPRLDKSLNRCATVRLGSRGRLAIGEMQGDPHEEGFRLARAALLARAARRPGTAPVVAPVGTLMTVLDIRALSQSFAMAA